MAELIDFIVTVRRNDRTETHMSIRAYDEQDAINRAMDHCHLISLPPGWIIMDVRRIAGPLSPGMADSLPAAREQAALAVRQVRDQIIARYQAGTINTMTDVETYLNRVIGELGVKTTTGDTQ